MNGHHKFLFDNDFDSPPAEPEALAGVPEQRAEGDRPEQDGEASASPAEQARYGEDDLTAAREAGYREGKAAGREEAAKTAEHAISETLARLPEALKRLADEPADMLEDAYRDSLGAAVAILRRLFPRLAQQHGLGEIEAVVADCLKRLRHEPRVVVRLHDSQLDGLKQLLDPLLESTAFDGKVVLIADEATAPSDVRVEWADGGSERDSGRLWRDVEKILDRIAPSSGGQQATADPSAAPAASAAQPASDGTTPEAPQRSSQPHPNLDASQVSTGTGTDAEPAAARRQAIGA